MFKGKIKTFFILIIGIILVVNLSRNLLRLLNAAKRIDQKKKEVALLQKEEEDLKRKKEYVESEEFVEKEAREKLNMSKEGEAVALLPENLKKILGISRWQGREDQKTNFQRWLEVFGF